MVALTSSAVCVVDVGGDPERQAVASTAMQRSSRCICSVLSPSRPASMIDPRATYGDGMSAFIPSHTAPGAATLHRFFHVVGSSVWVTGERHDAGWPEHFLGMLDDEACWGVDVPVGTDPADGAAIDLRSFFARAGEVEWLVAGRAVQLVEWARTHRFCGRCGTPTEQQPGERAMRCPACGLLAFPRIAPAMITLVTRGRSRPCWPAACSSRVRCTAAWPASSSPANRWRVPSSARCARRSASRSATSATGAASRGRSRTA